MLQLLLSMFAGGRTLHGAGFWAYKTQKTIVYDVWQLGFTYRVLQALIAIYVVVYLYLLQAGWAYAERPMGSFNAWSESGTSGAIVKGAKSLDNAFVYCGNSSYSYEWASGWNYGEPPLCRKLNKNEATTKALNGFFFTTIYIEYHYHGWACHDSTHATEVAACAARSGSWAEEGDGQCQCSSEQAYYPVGVEHMVLAMEMSYTTSPKFGDVTGSTNAADSVGAAGSDSSSDLRPLQVFITAADGTPLPTTVDSDGAIRLSVGEYLRAAGLSLEDANDYLPPDHRYKSPKIYPRFRTAGVNVDLEVRFHNTADNDGTLGHRFDALFSPAAIRAEVVPHANRRQWAGLGPVMHYEAFPSGPQQQSFHKVERYRQGVVFRFKGVGSVLTFDFMQLVSMLVQVMALLKLAAVIVEQFAINWFLPPAVSTTLKKKKNERITATSELAALGLRAAIGATQYNLLDPNGNRRIETLELANAFAPIEGVSARQAYEIAQLVTSSADTDYYERKSSWRMVASFVRGKAKKTDVGIRKRRDAKLANEGLDFAEFMTCIAGDAIGFADFVKTLPPQDDKEDGGRLNPTILRQIEQSFAEVRGESGKQGADIQPVLVGAELALKAEPLPAPDGASAEPFAC